MRVLTFVLIIVTVAAAHAAGAKPRIATRPGSPLPAKEMQAIGPSSDFEVAPKFVSGEAPIYPITRLRLREPGFAVISFAVDETGHTRDFRVLKTNYPYFAGHAIAAIQKWRFQPATKHGRPVSCRLRIPITYRVRG